MSENTKIWDLLGRTDPKHTKKFKRAGGFEGSAIKPIWSFRRMTEEFGPCGIGWGVGEPKFDLVPGPEGEMLVFCTASVWYKNGDEVSQAVYGVGGDKPVGKNKYGISTDDEAYKKAYTDAITNALKLIGVGADVHMGLFEDNKYVQDMKDEFADNPAYVQKKDGTGYKDAKGFSGGQMNSAGKRRTIDEIVNDMNDVKTHADLDKLKAEWSPTLKQWREDDNEMEVTWRGTALELFEAKRSELNLKFPRSTLEAG